MGAAMAARVERASGGAIKRQQLRRDWREVWPELELMERAERALAAASAPPQQEGRP